MTTPVRGRLPRDEILDRTDLPALADELLGPRRGRGATVNWRCPSHQPQTGRTPPVSIFTTTRGEQRWHCHACGTGGTAIDLLMQARGLNVRGALEALAARAHLTPRDPSPPHGPDRQRADRPTRQVSRSSPLLADHVERCTRVLWTRNGRPVRDWLARRGFTDETLRTQRVGADPGPRVLERARGLPRAGLAAILPVHDDAGAAVYFQARYLNPDTAYGRKYDNPTAALATNPRLAHYTPTTPSSDTVYVCEGIPDALSITQAGHRAVAVLGAGLAGPQIAERLAATYPDTPLRIAFDADPQGALATDLLLDELHDLDHPDTDTITLPSGICDVNDWLTTTRDDFAAALTEHTPLTVPMPAVTLDANH